MSEIITVQDLETLKKHEIFEAEVLTGKVGGLATGVDIDYATNQVTGQVQKTLPQILSEIGFKPGSGDFTTGFTVMPGQRDYAWFDPVSAEWYSYLGVIPALGHVVAPGTNPVGDPDWRVTSEHLFTQSGAGAVTRPAQDKMRETVSGEDFGAVGDGATNDLAALRAAKNLGGFAELGGDNTYYFGNSYAAPNDPDFLPSGAGSLKWGNDILDGFKLNVDLKHQDINLTPTSWFRATRKNEMPSPLYPPYAPPGRGTDLFSIFNTAISFGSGLNDKSKQIRQVTAVGSNIGLFPIHWELVDAYGQDSMMFAQYAQRSTAIGTETFIWAGATSKQYLIDTNHDWYRNIPPSEWTAANNAYEAAVPGIGARIDSYTDYATSYNDFVHNVALGRDAGGHLVKGDGNIFVGYSCAGEMLKGSNNIGIGLNALRYSGFSDKLIAIGRWAGSASCDGYWSVMIGDSVLKDTNAVIRTVAIGNEAGLGATSAVGAVLLGNDAGKYAGENLDNQLIIDSSNTNNPLISGGFSSRQVGINVPWNGRRAGLHVRDNTSGSSLTARTGLLVEGSATSNVTVESNATGFSSLAFATPSSNFIGGVQYNNSINVMLFIVNGVEQARFEPGAGLCFRPAVDNNQVLGRASFRWSTVYAGTGTINTSDAREKTAPLPIDDAVLDAWADVQLATFQWLESIRLKGEDARWHFGVIAQQVRDTFLAHGLDGTDYGLLCYDEWGAKEAVIDEKGNEIEPAVVAGDRWGIRPDQCLFLEAAYQRRRCDRIEARLSAAGL